MWTPKRTLLLVAGFCLFATLYVVYTLFLGGIDGIMPLPQEYQPTDNPITVKLREPGPNEAVKKLQVAFGPESKEVKERTIKLMVPARRMVLATNMVEIQKDGGCVKITPFSVALFGKDKGDGSFPEINTVQADEAYLTLDRPINNQFEMSNRKVVGGELRGKIDIVNNRGTPQTNDNITLLINNGKVFYEEKRHIIWTPDDVLLEDLNSKPEPTRIRSRGMELYLVQDAPEARPEKEKGKGKGQAAGGGESVSGVERVVLLSQVDKHLWVDSRSGFLGPPEKKKETPPGPAAEVKPAKEPEKSHIVIQTNGPFVYHVQKDLARFDSPEPPKSADAPKPSTTAERRGKLDTADVVVVRREHSEGDSRWFDHIYCDQLELQFRPKPRAVVPGEHRPVSTADKSGDREIESAVATARPGSEVVLSLDQECVEAFGNKLVYTAAKGKQGATTVLSGTPLEAYKEGHKITAVEMTMVSANSQGEGQSAEAQGPGEIYLFDKTKNPEENQFPCHARWKDKLVLTKDKIGDRSYDLLTLTTDAAFVDDDHKQELIGQRLQVWLEPGGGNDPPGASADKQAPGLLSRQRPYKIEAQGQVRVDSPELRIRRDCQNLIVVFQDAPPSLPDALPGPPAAEAGAERLTLMPVLPPPPATDAPPSAKPAAKGVTIEISQPAPAKTAPPPPDGTAPDGGTKPKEAPRPIDLGARTVRANVLRRGSAKNELQTVYAEGGVTVHQDGSGPKDKGVNITGEMLQLDRDPAGDRLQVFGDGREKVAELQLGELILIGPKVVIDQRDNTASVEGGGTMDLPSNTTFEGGKPAKEGARLTVNWNDNMFFNGRDADFHGGVIAYQTQPDVKDKARLQCRTLQVTLDRNVSLKEGQKAGESAKVDKLVCWKQIEAVNVTFDEKGKMLQFHRLENREMVVDNRQDMTRASGPGRVSILQYGAADEFAPPTAGTPNKKAATGTKQPDVLKLTRVLFDGSMFSKLKDGARTTHFNSNVRVAHLPSDDPDAKVDEDKLPKNSFVMRSESLEVLSRAAGDQRKGQYMVARIRVEFRTPEFTGKADTLVYNESAETVLFQGTVGNPARIWRFRGPGVRPEEISGNQILYFRKTGQFQVVGGNRIQS